MKEKPANSEQSDIEVDQTLVAAHLRMSYEQRIEANDHAIKAILELRHAFQQQIHSRR